MLFTHFYLVQGKKEKPGLCLQQAGNTLALNPLSCQQIDKNTLGRAFFNHLLRAVSARSALFEK